MTFDTNFAFAGIISAITVITLLKVWTSGLQAQK